MANPATSQRSHAASRNIIIAVIVGILIISVQILKSFSQDSEPIGDSFVKNLIANIQIIPSLANETLTSLLPYTVEGDLGTVSSDTKVEELRTHEPVKISSKNEAKDLSNRPLDKLTDERSELLKRLEQLDQEISKKSQISPQKDHIPSLEKKINEPITTNILKTARIPGRSANLRSVESCKYDFKVYVYDIPKDLPSVLISEQARKNHSFHICQKCILEQFSLEYIMVDFFTQFCGRTYNPDEADYFYLPIVRDAEYRHAMQMNVKSRAPSLTELALIEMVEKNDSTRWINTFKVTDKYWKRRNGCDHIIVMPAPVTNLRHESSQRGFFHYMSHLNTPIFLGLEYSRSFVKEYPICSSIKNIVVPYPMTDPSFYNGNLIDPKYARDSLLYYAGGLHGDCVEVRKAIKDVMINSTKIPGVIAHVKRTMEEREHGFLSSIFCPIPIGDSPSSKRMYDVMNFGCIPVILSDDLVWAFEDRPDARNFSISMPQNVIQFPTHLLLSKYKSNKVSMGILPSGLLLYDILEESHKSDPAFINGIYVNPLVKILLRVPMNDILALHTGVRLNAPNFRYYRLNSSMTIIPTALHSFPEGGAIDMIAASLSHKKKTGVEKIRDQCLAERSQKHAYINRYPCEKGVGLYRYRRFL